MTSKCHHRPSFLNPKIVPATVQKSLHDVADGNAVEVAGFAFAQDNVLRLFQQASVPVFQPGKHRHNEVAGTTPPSLPFPLPPVRHAY